MQITELSIWSPRPAEEEKPVLLRGHRLCPKVGRIFSQEASRITSVSSSHVVKEKNIQSFMIYKE